MKSDADSHRRCMDCGSAHHFGTSANWDYEASAVTFSFTDARSDHVIGYRPIWENFLEARRDARGVDARHHES